MIAKLNKNQIDYLRSNLSLENKVLSDKLIIVKETDSCSIEIDEETADEIYEWATNKLQKTGFDINYELTPEGKMLESLRDLFNV